jgi:hypothetical protein
VTFRWTYPRTLRSNEAYQILIWKQAEAHLGAAPLQTTMEQTIDLDELLPQRGGYGEYLWSVVLRDKGTEAPLSSEASPWRLNYVNPASGGGGDSPPINCVVCNCDLMCRRNECKACCQECCDGCK